MRTRIVLLVGGFLLITAAVFGQQPPPPEPQPMPPGMHHEHMQMQPGQPQSMDCQAMMQKMESSAKAMDDRLGQLVSDMNKAKGSAKVDRMGAVINELVAQRAQMRADMMAMMPQMMGHMMQHMQSGMAQSMAGCPMMKAAAGKTEPPAPPGQEH